MKKKGKHFRSNKKHLKFEKKVFRCFKRENGSLNYKQISAILDLHEHYDIERIKHALENICSKGQIIELSPGKYKLNIREEEWNGKVVASKYGRLGFKDEESGEFFSIKSRDYGQLIDGDRINCKIYKDGRKRKRFARPIELIERTRNIFVGRIQKTGDFAFVLPTDKRIHVDFFVKSLPNDIEDGCIVKVGLEEWRSGEKSPRAKILEVMGGGGGGGGGMRSILIEKGFDLIFSDKALACMDSINFDIQKDEEINRRDFRNISTFTIDPVDAKDFDDALSLHRLKNGLWEVGIHIADVTYYLEEGSLLDKEAFKRATSVYLADRVLPMLPEKMSNHWCSLVPNETRRCFSAVFEIDDDGVVQNEWYGRTLIHSDRRFDYLEAMSIIEAGEGDFVDELKVLLKLSKKLRKKRLKDGAIAFESNEVRFEFNDNGRPNKINIKERVDTHKLIEEFMLLANRMVASFLRKKDVHDHNVYRVHDLPDEEKVFELIRFARKFDINISYQSPRQFTLELNKMMKIIEEGGASRMLQQMAIKTMAKAVYTSKNIGHYGLGFDNYTHFTSPIRRYADVIVHRKLQSVLDKETRFNKFDLEARCEHISKQEKKAMEAERASTKYMKVLFMEDKVGEVYEGVISSMMDWGFFVEIPETTCEGAIRISDLNEIFYFDPASQAFLASYGNTSYQLGDKIKVEVKAVNVDQRTIDFKLV